MLLRLVQSTLAWGCAGAAGAAAAYYLTESARGSTRGAPGYTKALSTLGKSTGGSMREGVLVLGASAAVSGAFAYCVVAPSAPVTDDGSTSEPAEATADAESEAQTVES